MTQTNAYEKTFFAGEEELVMNLQSGNQYNFKKIYDRFAGVLYGTIMNWIKDPQIAENLLQDVFIKAWANREVYNAEKGRLFTWLYNIFLMLFIILVCEKLISTSLPLPAP